MSSIMPSPAKSSNESDARKAHRRRSREGGFRSMRRFLFFDADSGRHSDFKYLNSQFPIRGLRSPARSSVSSAVLVDVASKPYTDLSKMRTACHMLECLPCFIKREHSI